MLTITHTWQCSLCPATRTEKQSALAPGLHVIDYGHIPAFGWNWVDGRLVCPLHEIVVKEKGDAT